MTNARRKWRNYSQSEYLLSALCRCGLCGSTMHGNLVTSKNKKFRYYVCTARSPGIIGMEKCALSSINADTLEHLVWEKVASWLRNPEELEKEIKSGLPDDIGEKEQRLKQLQQSLYNEINAFIISNKELTGIRDIASRVVDMLDKLEFDDRYSIVRSLVEEVIVTNETIIIKAKIPALVQNIGI
jgi:site-specific DNA recombinase